MRRLLIGFLAALGMLANASPAHALDRAWVGTNAQWVFPSLPRSAWDVHADAMAAAGVGVVRLDASWSRVEPSAPVSGVHSYDWGFYDDVVATLARRGLRWYPVIDYSAPWAGEEPGAWRTPPRDAGEFATYAAALAARYGRGGAFWRAHPELPQVPVREWEVWNEQNGAYFWPGSPDPAAYAELYAATHAAIHAVDPAARVVVGGLIGRGAGAFLRDMVAARPGLAIDAVGLHAYALTVQGAVFWLEDVRNWLTHLGYGSVPIEVTEFGWTTVGTMNVASDEQRAAMIAELLRRAAAIEGISRMIVHTWASRELSAGDGEHWYGLFGTGGTPNASGRAFARAVGELVAPAPTPTPTPTPEPEQEPEPATSTTTPTPPPPAAAPATATATSTSPAAVAAAPPTARSPATRKPAAKLSKRQKARRAKARRLRAKQRAASRRAAARRRARTRLR